MVERQGYLRVEAPAAVLSTCQQTSSPSPFDLIDSIDGILEELKAKGFGGVDRKVVLRNLSASAGGGFSAESIDALRDYSPDKLKSAVTATEVAYRRSVDFLVTRIRVESAEVLPYKNQLTVLAEVFRLVQVPTAVLLNDVVQIG
jgi:hypothetical protein